MLNLETWKLELEPENLLIVEICINLEIGFSNPNGDGHPFEYIWVWIVSGFSDLSWHESHGFLFLVI